MTAHSCRAGVLPFAKRGDDRGNNLIRLQQMFPRIVAADFQQPLHVSKECQHLLSRMLTPDPARRITIGEIMQHQWCARLFWLAAKHARNHPRSSHVHSSHLQLLLSNMIVESNRPCTCLA